MKIEYVTKSGKLKGKIQIPHLHKNNKYVVSKTRYSDDYVYVDSYGEVIDHLKKGLKVRVSNKKFGSAPSLVNLKSLVITENNSEV